MIHELSIIIPTLNEEHYLSKLLTSLVSQDFSGKLQIIVVDGNSTDNTVKIAKSYKKFLSDLLVIPASRGIGHQRNIGAQHAKYKYIAFIDADMILPKGFLKNIVSKINYEANFIVTTFVWPANKNILDFVILVLGYPLLLFICLFDPLIPGECIFTTRRNHDHIKGFNEKIKLFEDIDYGRRSIKAGAKYQMFFTPYLFHSSRRAREMGRIGLLAFWLKAYIYTKRHGPITSDTPISYRFGHYKGEN